MKKDIYISATGCVTPLGFDVASNVSAIRNGDTGIRKYEDVSMLPVPFHAAIIDAQKLDAAFSEKFIKQFSKLEKMLILAMDHVIDTNVSDSRCGFVLSTTKGNIDALTAGEPISQAHLPSLASKVAAHFGFSSQPIVISNACASGIMAVSIAARLIESDVYDEVYVAAGDLVSPFVLSGFHSFQAMSAEPCKPYSANRSGVNLGEAAAAVRVSRSPVKALARIVGDASINDANHISGPSRTGEGLVLSVQRALDSAQLTADDIGYISAHGTATPFNDEMEAVAFNRLGLAHVPVNSLKGIYGHTLGASGLLETVIGVESLITGELFASRGFDVMGVSSPINVITVNTNADLDYFIKTASGFGGCNTAVIFKKV